MTVDTNTLQLRDVIDHWRLIQPLGHGAWLAEDVLVEGAQVRIEPSLYSDPTQHERAWRLLAKLRRHPGFVAAVALTSKDGPKADLLVLDTPEGQTLEERVANGPLSVEESVAILEDVARAVAAMHDAGFVHDRLEPAVIHLGAESGTRLWGVGRCLSVGLSADPIQDVPGLARCLYSALTSRPAAAGWLEASQVLDPGPRAPEHLRRLIIACTTERAYDCPANAREFLNRLTVADPVKTSDDAVVLPQVTTQRVSSRRSGPTNAAPDIARSGEPPVRGSEPPVRGNEPPARAGGLREPPVRGSEPPPRPVEPPARPSVPPVRAPDPRKDSALRIEARGAEPPVKMRPTLPIPEPADPTMPLTNPGVESAAVRMVRLSSGRSTAEKVPSATKDWEGKGSEPGLPRDPWVTPAAAPPAPTPWTTPPAVPEVPRVYAPPEPAPPPEAEPYFSWAGIAMVFGLAVLVGFLANGAAGMRGVSLDVPQVSPPAAAAAAPTAPPTPTRKGAELCITNRERLGGATVLVDGVADTTGERCVHRASEDSVRFQVFCAVEPAPTRKKAAAALPPVQPWIAIVEQDDTTSVICDPGTRPCHCHLANKPADL